MSRIRFGDRHSNSSHYRENIVPIQRNSLTGCFLETGYLKEGTTDLTMRAGLTDRITVDANVPYIWRQTKFSSGGAGGNAAGIVDAIVQDDGIGDISVGASYRLLGETRNRPDVVISGRVKVPVGQDPFGVSLIEIADSEGNLSVPERLPLGTGVYSASTSISLLKTIDPLVVFGSITSFRNFQQDFDDVDEIEGMQPGTVRLGDSLQYGAGVAVAFNDTSSMSFSFTQRLTEASSIRSDGSDRFREVVGSDSNVGQLNIGASFALSETMALLSNISIGITDDAPDMTLSARIPIQF